MTVSQELSFKMYDFDNKFWGGAATTYETIRNADKLEELEDYMNSIVPAAPNLEEPNDYQRFRSKKILRDLELLEAEDNEEKN